MATPRAVYVLSAALHVALGSAVAAVRPKPVRETVTVTVRDVRRPRPTPPPPAPAAAPEAPAAAAVPSPAPPTPAPQRGHAHARSHAPSPAPTAAPSAPGASSSGAADFGVALGNERGVAVPGGGSGGGGSGGGDAQPAAHASHDDECDDAPVRPRVLEMPEPEYPDAARDEGIEGRVRVELSLDDEGHVVRARVLQGLGHGLDEAALAAARGARFDPATRCGRAVATTFTVAIRFAL